MPEWNPMTRGDILNDRLDIKLTKQNSSFNNIIMVFDSLFNLRPAGDPWEEDRIDQCDHAELWNII